MFVYFVYFVSFLPFMQTTALKYLGQHESQLIDQRLMSDEYGFTLDILMELAGLSSAEAIAEAYPLSSYKHVIVIAGPGNNGGDGFVCARHLRHFGYSVDIVYPKKVERHPYVGLLKQCKTLGLPILDNLPEDFENKYSLIIDAIFGFSFSGPIREPFMTIIKKLTECKIPIASIDIPSGWDVEKGPVDTPYLQPDTLISLTAPKLGAQYFTGRYHFLGGRFVPPDMAKDLNLPPYPGTQQFVLLPPNPKL